ncbi:MAG: dethiobiotin synthase [Deltaproteobacteria bacterium]|nr:MAG: dethiobiotin synthase [Deltaproteobacteria bacterium]
MTRRKGLFITGTDTGVGKTWTGAALTRFLVRQGLRVAVCKPVETGVADPSRPGADAGLLLEACGCDWPLELAAPYRLTRPLAPDQAARMDQVRLDINHMTEAVDALADRADFIIVEGAGGLMVPLSGGMLIADLAARLNFPLLVVARPNLGTINHTLLTTFAARQMNLALAGVIISGMPATPDEAEANAPHAIASLASAPLLATLPHIDAGMPAGIDLLADALERSPSLPWLQQALGL